MSTASTLFSRIGRPKFVVAPMVDQSELAFRMLCRKYGAQLCYTPMVHSVMWNTSAAYRDEVFSTCPEDRPLFIQFCGNDPAQLLAAAQSLQDKCDAVDLNLGCPQGIARRGHYGAFLLTEKELLVKIVKTMTAGLTVPVTCKIRLLPKLEDTIDLALALQEAGCALLTVHGRTKEMKQDMTGPCDWDAIKAVKQRLSIPVFANGGIGSLADVERCLAYTGVDGVMSSEGVLENPALFCGNIHPQTGAVVTKHQMTRDYFDMIKKYGTSGIYVKSHLFKMLYSELARHPDLQEQAHNSVDNDVLERVATELMTREASNDGIPADETKDAGCDDGKCDMTPGVREGSKAAGGPWYHRHRVAVKRANADEIKAAREQRKVLKRQHKAEMVAKKAGKMARVTGQSPASGDGASVGTPLPTPLATPTVALMD